MNKEELFTFLGIVVLIVAAFFDALGYNIQRRDHCKNAASAKPRHECFRKYWHMGLYIYVGSLLIGNFISNSFVPPHWVAPVTTSSLIFNIVFARILVGSVITKRDIIGTGVILVGIIAIVFLSTLHDSDQAGLDLKLEDLEIIFSRLSFQIYFAIFNSFILLGFIVYLYLSRLINKPSKKSKAPSFLAKMDLKILKRNTAILTSILGGAAVAETVLLARSGIFLLLSTFNGEWPFFKLVPIIIVLGLVLSSLFQLYCLNAGLKLADSVIVSPIFSSVYNFFALVNSLVFLDQFKQYKPYVLVLLALSVGLLILGVVLLASQVKPEPIALPKLPRMKLTRRKPKPPNQPEVQTQTNLPPVVDEFTIT